MAAQGRGAGWGGPNKQEKNQGHNPTYTSDTKTIKSDIFDCGRQEHAMAFERALTRVMDYIHHEGKKESILITEAIETLTTQMCLQGSQASITQRP
jgi:hypothetical protein